MEDSENSSTRSLGDDPQVARAVRISHLGSLPADTSRRLFDSATRIEVPAGSMMHREGDRAAHLQLVVTGLFRVFVTAPDGRTLTVRYCRPGSILGAVSLFASPFSMPASVQAITDASLLSMPARTIKQAAERDVVVARALLEELSERVVDFLSEIPGSAFATVRQRMARHLLDLASAEPGSDLTVTINQQELADAVGTVREVVVRSLRELKDEGLVATRRNGITILDAPSLSAEAYPTRGGTQVPDPWDQRR